MAATPVKMKSIPAACADRLEQLQGDGRTEDFTITCDGAEWKVHSQVLFLHSDVFGKAVSGAFKESEDGVLDFPDEGATCISKLIEYLYTFDYVAEAVFVGLPLSLHTQLCLAGDKYNIQHLKELALNKLRIAATERDDTYSWGGFLDDLEEAAHVAWELASVTKDVREVLVNMIVRRQHLISDAEDAKRLEAIMQENGGMAIEVVRAAVMGKVRNKEMDMYQCPTCNKKFAIFMLSSLAYRCPACSLSITAEAWQAHRTLK